MSANQIATEQLRQWIIDQTRAGCQPAAVLEAMKASGWDEQVALDALEQTLRSWVEPAAAGPAATFRSGPANSGLDSVDLPRTVPEPALDGRPALPLSDGHSVQVISTLREPRVVVFGGLLSEQECAGLMALAAPRLIRSETVHNESGGSEVHASRTSDGMFFERGEQPLIAAIEARIAELLCWPVSHGEGLQILRYRPGAEYKPHYDYFDPKHSGTPRILERGGQRVGTLLIYLNAPDGGGGTVFPDAGLEVAPVRGNAVFFSYDRAHPGTKTLHGGAPVTAGEKWVATKWLREGLFV